MLIMVFLMVFAALICFACALWIGKNAETLEKERIKKVEASYGLIFADDTFEDNKKSGAPAGEDG